MCAEYPSRNMDPSSIAPSGRPSHDSKCIGIFWWIKCTTHSCDSFGLKHECPLIPNRTNNTGWFFQLLTWPFLYWTFFTRLLFVLVPWFYGFINPYAISKRIWVLFWLVFAFTWAIYSSLVFYVTHHSTEIQVEQNYRFKWCSGKCNCKIGQTNSLTWKQH